MRAFDDGGREEGYQDDGVCGEGEAGEMGDGVWMVQEPVQTTSLLFSMLCVSLVMSTSSVSHTFFLTF